jgi:hypothetical protein
MSASRFVNNRAESPTTRTVNLSSDRSAAKSLKISQKASKLSSTAPAPGYASNPSAPRNTYSSHQYQPHQNSAFSGGGLDNVSVASDFDATITSDLGVEHRYADQDNGYYEDEGMHSDEVEPPTTIRSHSNSPFQHRLQHKQNQNPMVDQIAEPEPQRHRQTPSISGRFDGQQPQFENLAHRSFEDHASARISKGTRKRSRSGERNQPSIVFEERSSELDTLEDDDLPMPDPNLQPDLDDHEDNFETPSNSPRKNRPVQNPTTSQASARAAKAPTPNERSELPEYSDESLRKMAYADLEKEPWEKADYKKGFQLAKPLKDNSSLQEKLEHYTFKVEEQDAQVAFFSQLSLEEWEEGGDWFVERFTELLTEMKKKRMEKKQIAKKYEDEISNREKLVRGKSDHLDREFRDMRVGGEGILKGKKV